MSRAFAARVSAGSRLQVDEHFLHAGEQAGDPGP
jgi:hypothetical protein